MPLLYDDFVTLFNASWDTNIIAKPTIIDGTIQNYGEPNTIKFGEKPTSLKNITIPKTRLNRSYGGSLTYFAKNDTDLEKMIEGTLKLFTNHTKLWIPDLLDVKDRRVGMVIMTLDFHEQEVITPETF